MLERKFDSVARSLATPYFEVPWIELLFELEELVGIVLVAEWRMREIV